MPERVGAADEPPQRELDPALRLELERPAQERERLVELVAADGQLRRTLQPHACPLAQARVLRVRARPGEVGVLGSHGFGVVVGEKGRVLVAPLASSQRANRACRRARRSFERVA